MNDINDIRTSKEFKGISFSNFQKSKVKKELIISISGTKVEAACYWAAELICAGHFSDLWEALLLYVGKFVHLGNPKLPIYLEMRFNNFKSIIQNGYSDEDLSLRNSSKIRQIFAEIIAVLCFSTKKHSFEPIKIKKNEEFSMSYMASKLKAPSIDFAKDVFEKDDPKEIYIAINEFAYNISFKVNNSVNACYWLEWLLEYENLCKKRKEKCEAERRTFPQVGDKYQKDVIWILWDIILRASEKQNNSLKTKILNSLLTLFCIRYTSGAKKRRRFILYYAITLITEPSKLSTDIITDKEKIENIVKRIEVVYKDIKKNEIAPETDYLFSGLKKTNLDRTIQRLEAMDKLMNKD
tara:strand:+ start:3476 stop:4534 length:1059 start_codon:yes stop_codon:yes gene_type:complete